MPELIGDPKVWAAAFAPTLATLEQNVIAGVAAEVQKLPASLVEALDGLQITTVTTITRKVQP